MGGTAASAGYMVAVPAERIFAREATLTGSIGVLLETGEVSGLLGKIGISDRRHRLRAAEGPAQLHQTDVAGGAAGAAGPGDGHVRPVRRHGRHRSPHGPARVRELADGRAYTGHQALKLGLVDQIGDEHDAREWLAKTKGVSADLPVDDLSTTAWPARLFSSSIGWVVDAFGKACFPKELCLTAPGRSGNVPATELTRLWPIGTHDQVGTHRGTRRQQSASAGCRRRTDRRHDLRPDHRRAVPRRAGGTARLRRLHREAAQCPHRPQSRAPARRCRWTRRRCPSSRPARNCASG